MPSKKPKKHKGSRLTRLNLKGKVKTPHLYRKSRYIGKKLVKSRRRGK